MIGGGVGGWMASNIDGLPRWGRPPFNGSGTVMHGAFDLSGQSRNDRVEHDKWSGECHNTIRIEIRKLKSQCAASVLQ